MGVGTDPTQSGQSKISLKQQPENVTLNGNTVVTEEVVDVGGLVTMLGLSTFNNQILPGLIKFTIAPGASTVCNITIQVQDNGSQNITQTDGKTPQVYHLDVSLANANGTITSLTPSTGIATVTGTTLNTYVATKALYIESNASGQIVVSITDTGRQGFYVMVQGGNQPMPSISRQLVTGDYG